MTGSAADQGAARFEQRHRVGGRIPGHPDDAVPDLQQLLELGQDPVGAVDVALEAGDIQLPWASVLGFADVLGLMALVIWLAHKRQRRRAPARGETR